VPKKKIDAGIILGSGIDMPPHLRIVERIPYSKLGLPIPSVKGHGNLFVIAQMAGKMAGIFTGRLHLYEGYSPQEVCQQVKIIRNFGADNIVISNASGIVNKNFKPAQIMLIKDQINLTGKTPFIAKKNDVKFLNCSGIYFIEKLKYFNRICKKYNVKLEVGVLAGVRGPEYETPAEVRMLRRLGADAVCMSTVIEALQAHVLGMRVFGISVLTNYAGEGVAHNAHKEVLNIARTCSGAVWGLIEAFVLNKQLEVMK